MRLYRLRVGEYRVFYAVEGEKVIILGVEHRASPSPFSMPPSASGAAP
jgi:mRNA-degrading endonuclease RelE of RelBE toxin-antitoxin system